MNSDIQKAYDAWSGQYDTNENKTRDLEAKVLRAVLSDYEIGTCLEVGCGTGKNTLWLSQHCEEVLAVDFSSEMLQLAKSKIQSNRVQFQQADILRPWSFLSRTYDLITFSLVLEHISDLNSIFSKASDTLLKGGLVYIGELHPFKQYTGSKARFETINGVQEITCFTHHISDYIEAAGQHGLHLILFKEFFDQEDQDGIPRILSLTFQKR